MQKGIIFENWYVCLTISGHLQKAILKKKKKKKSRSTLSLGVQIPIASHDLKLAEVTTQLPMVLSSCSKEQTYEEVWGFLEASLGAMDSVALLAIAFLTPLF